MSSFGFNPTIFDIENSSNSQNAGLQTRKMKREDAGRGNGPQACKRAALGTLSTNVTRKQPSRAAKQVVSSDGFYNCQDENSFPRAQAGKSTGGSWGSFGLPPAMVEPSFSIHVDSEPAPCQTKVYKENSSSEPPLSHLVTSLQVERRPLECVFTSLNESASPMVLDTSIQEEESITSTETEDFDNSSDIFGVKEYAEDIYEYLREAELRNRPKPGYMRKQPDITPGMRSILIDWLVEVGEEYRLHNETLYLAVSYIDRFLSQMSVLRSKLQLVGAASMFLAAKFEEIYPPEVNEFVYITDDTYTVKQVLRMEHLILKVLSFDVAVPTANVFISRYLQSVKADSRMEHLSRFLAELTLQDHEFIKYIPSTIAAAAVFLANFTLSGLNWTEQLQKGSGYSLQDIMPCAIDLLKAFTDAPSQNQQAVREKYKSQRYNSVSLILAPTALPSW
ncbi:G2/mitotic-specific cyclin-A-like [Asterias amurensis]|uniref:G2/mitotic-specific cyclin-A-like n=1 Tax=Asterias amurensis TaxID=7602 RepID=UPI003AB1790C